MRVLGFNSCPQIVSLLCWIARLTVVGTPCAAHDLITTKITWSREISRLFQERCLSCHRENGPEFSLTTYEQVRPWAKAIKEEVLARRMPPWGAVKGFGDFQHDRSLAQEEISLIAQWVEGGAPAGDPALLPPKISFVSPAAVTNTMPVATRRWEISGDQMISKASTLIAVQPRSAVDGSRLVALLPDQSLIPLLWVYQYPTKAVTPPFFYRTPVELPAGSRLLVYTPAAGARFTIWIQPATLTKRQPRE